MSDAALRTDGALEAQPRMGVRNLHNYFYCPRLFYFQWVENIFQENADTVEGRHVHRNVDVSTRLADPKELNLAEGVRLRSLRLESEALGLTGVVDLVEGEPEGTKVLDYKKGAARRNAEGERIAKEPDAVQIAAYALLLAERGIKVARGAIYYAADKRQVAVELTESLFERVRRGVAEARAVAASGTCPPPLREDPRCLYCSAYPICLPKESLWWASARREFIPDPQMRFAFDSKSGDALRDRLLDVLEFAAETSGKASPTLQPPRPERDEGEVLVVQTPGAQVGQRGEEITVSVKGELLRKLPGHQVRAIYLYGAVQLTAQAVATCLDLGIDLAYFSPAGRFLGMLRGLPTSGVDARRGQYRLFELSGVRLRLAREVVRAKIHNQRVMLMRNGEVSEQCLRVLAHFREAAGSANGLTELLGIEGNAAAVYFEQFESMLKEREDWKFDWRGRNRRPPRDPVNALLSLGYSMLVKELAGVCYAVGLDPFLGFMHQPRYGRPALALDLMEEFRPLVADSVAISLINRGELGPEDFICSTNGAFLNDHGRKVFWEAWFRRMDTEVSHPEFGYKMAYRRMLDVQARQLWRFVRGEAGEYHGFTTR
ncbi:MAG: CRISPR-associated endonuclease Cas1 [Verrucomicrobiae bacterium]|nr:CRISPR-associated endonuclease Cas1 [Verrucomicrobiae bacterium]